MLQSQLFTKTRKEAPQDEESKNAQLLIRAGYIHKEMAGAYSYLPLGLRVLNKITAIIREEMNRIGGQEVLLTTLQDPKIWKQSGRWDDAVVDNWFKSKLATGTDIGIANTHEEPLTALLTHFVSSYKDLPLYIYQFQTKFRNELRAKSGLMRVREFLMKDLYSFSRSEEEFRKFYESCAGAYLKIFERVGIGAVTFRTIAAGGSFTTGLTDEFQTLSSAGEDVIYVDKERRLAINQDVYTDVNLAKLGLDKKTLVEEKSIEVGNIFPLGTKYPDSLGLKVQDEDGNEQSVIMGSYGIGLGRLMATIVEVFADEHGLVWPESVAPFAVHLLALGKASGDAIYRDLLEKGIEVLYDDRDVSAGQKLMDADLLGIPYRAVVSEKTGSKVELKRRVAKEVELMIPEALAKQLAAGV